MIEENLNEKFLETYDDISTRHLMVISENINLSLNFIKNVFEKKN